MALPDIIFLNGSTSSGKTTLARGLQKRLPAPYLHFGVDHVFPWLPPQWHDSADGFRFEPMPDGSIPVRIGPEASRVLAAWRRMVRAGADQGLRFVVDEVLIEPHALADWASVLAGLDVFFVGVRCDLAELQRREIARRDRGVGQAVSQHEAVHRGCSYDLEIDTTALAPRAVVDAALAGLAARTRPTAFEAMA